MVEDCDFSVYILADGDLGMAEGVIWTVGLDLVNDLLELYGQVFGKRACFLVSEDDIQFVGFEQRPVGVVHAAGCHRKAPVEIFPELGQVGITGFQVRNPTQAQFFDQTILEGLVGPLDPPFGLWAIGTDELDVQFVHCTSKLGQTAGGSQGALLIDPKDTMFVAVESHRLAVTLQVMAGGFAVAEKGFTCHEQQLQ